MINKVVSPTGAPFADAKEAIFKLPLVTGKKKTKITSKNSRILTYLPIYLLAFTLPHISPFGEMAKCISPFH